MKYYDKSMNVCLSTPPWGTAVLDSDVIKERYPNISEVDDFFEPIKKPDDTYNWDSTTETYIQSKHLARAALETEYDGYNLNNIRSCMGALRGGNTEMASEILAEGKQLQVEYYEKKVKLNE